MTNDNEERPWESRLTNETQKAFTYFNTYLSLGPSRSLSKVRTEHNNDISLQQLKNYSSKYNWVHRASLYDQHLIEEKNKRLKEEQDKYFEKRIQQLDQYHQATDAVLGQLMVDLGLIPDPQTNELNPNNRVNSTTVANSLQSLTNANAVTSKLALRFLGLPETIQDTQEVVLDADVKSSVQTEEMSKRYAEFTESIMNQDFIDKQLELIDKMVEKNKE